METTVAEKYRAVIGLDCHVQVYNLRQCGSDVMETTVAQQFRAVIGLDCHVQVYNLR